METRPVPFPIKSVVVAMLVVHAVLLAWSARTHSPVLNEVGHLPAGISHWQFGRFDLYRVNPPLVRMVAALPVMVASPATAWDGSASDALRRDEGRAGIDFVAANGRETFRLFAIGRWACIPFSLLGAWVCFRWSRDLYGDAAGLTAAALWCSCPNILGHAPLIMPDVPSAALGASACYAFWHWCRRPSWPGAVVAALALGLAQLTKTTLLVLVPLWPLLWLVTRAARLGGAELRKELTMLALQGLIALDILNAGYFCEGSFRKLGDYRFQSRALTGDRAGVVGNRFANTCLANVPIPFPSNYVQGIDAQKRDFERGAPSYLRGRWSDRGWWYFYVYAMAVKIPLGTWVLIGLATGITLHANRAAFAQRREILVVAPLVALLTAISSQFGFSVHFRYALPAFPFLFIWAGKAAMLLGSGFRAARGGFAAALAWSVCAGLYHYPHNIAYFNELVGGPSQGHNYLLGSNLDWGQDLLLVKRWFDDHPEARPFYYVGYGNVDPRMSGLELGDDPYLPSQEDATDLRPGWYAVDVYHLHSYPQGLARGTLDRRETSTPFGRLRPVDRVGYTTLIYRVDAGESASGTPR